MATIIRDQVRKLPAEQQELLADTELRRIHSRQQLLERARRGMTAWAGLWTGLTFGLAVLCVALPRALPFAIIAVAALVTYHATRLYRRLDALLDATEKERSHDDDRAT